MTDYTALIDRIYKLREEALKCVRAYNDEEAYGLLREIKEIMDKIPRRILIAELRKRGFPITWNTRKEQIYNYFIDVVMFEKLRRPRLGKMRI